MVMMRPYSAAMQARISAASESRVLETDTHNGRRSATLAKRWHHAHAHAQEFFVAF
jgi:hypothetical protein